MSWENATIRTTEELPHIPLEVVRQGRGVLRADAPEAGLSRELQQVQRDQNHHHHHHEQQAQRSTVGASRVDAVELARVVESPQQVGGTLCSSTQHPPHRISTHTHYAGCKCMPYRAIDVLCRTRQCFSVVPNCLSSSSGSRS